MGDVQKLASLEAIMRRLSDTVTALSKRVMQDDKTVDELTTEISELRDEIEGYVTKRDEIAEDVVKMKEGLEDNSSSFRKISEDIEHVHDVLTTGVHRKLDDFDRRLNDCIDQVNYLTPRIDDLVNGGNQGQPQDQQVGASGVLRVMPGFHESVRSAVAELLAGGIEAKIGGMTQSAAHSTNPVDREHAHRIELNSESSFGPQITLRLKDIPQHTLAPEVAAAVRREVASGVEQIKAELGQIDPPNAGHDDGYEGDTFG